MRAIRQVASVVVEEQVVAEVEPVVPDPVADLASLAWAASRVDFSVRVQTRIRHARWFQN